MRVTKKMLEAKVELLNKVTNSPQEYRTGSNTNIGHYMLDGAYGGYALHRVMNETGGVNNVFRCGHVPARELAGLVDAYIQGIYDYGDVS